MTTAIEFLWNKLEEIRVDLITKSISNEESAKQRAEAFEQAKEIEMIQITEAFNDGFENNCDADLYYNNKFKPDYKKES